MILSKTELIPQNLQKEESLFSTANGYIGVRGGFEEGYPNQVHTIRGCYANGFYDNVKLSYPEKLYGFPEEAQRMVNLPDFQTVKLSVNGETFSPFAGELKEYRRELDTRKGVASRRVKWVSPKGREVQVNILRMASFARQNLFLTVYDVTVPEGGEVAISAEINCEVSNYINPDDPRVASEKQRHIFMDEAVANDNFGLVRCHTGKSLLELAICQTVKADGECVTRRQETASGIETVIRKELKPGEKIRVEKYIAVSDSRREADPARHAEREALACRGIGAEALLSEQEVFLEAFWRSSSVEIYGGEPLNKGMEYNLFMLLSSAGRDALSGVAAKGLSGEGYEGHYFWDTEIYIIPFFTLTQPAFAKKLLEYRYNMLGAAREHARVMGHSSGALYPWRTISGSECSPYFPSGSAQYHINGDIAYSVAQYFRLTGDVSFMAEMGCEILLETARLWLDAGCYDRQGRFCLNGVTGPDEYTCIVNNNFYTNQTARHNLLSSVEVYGLLKEKNLHGNVKAKIKLEEAELQAFEKAAEAMYLPFDEKLSIHAQDDSFLEKPVWDLSATPRENFPLLLHYHPLTLYRHQVCKQADTVLAHFLFENGADEEILRKSYGYYEKITTHDSSLSVCVFSIMAARLGMTDKAYDYFMQTVRTDLDDSHGNTKDGIHTANMGGAYMCLTYGFAGLRVKKDGLHFRFTLPRQWSGYRFSVWYGKSKIAVSYGREGERFTLEEGPPVTVTVEGKKIELP